MTASAGAGGNLPPNKVNNVGNPNVNSNSGLPPEEAQSQSTTARKEQVNKNPDLVSNQAAQASSAYAMASLNVSKPADVRAIIAQALANPSKSKLSSGVLSGLTHAGQSYSGQEEFPEELADAGFSGPAMQAFKLAAQQA